jgi:glycosyltransferase involved in cell wall biosynthesis
MASDINYIQLAEKLQCCVIIPTFNNANTLDTVINDVRKYVGEIIVVNDGSTDKTSDVLSACGGITVINYKPNKGKGYALRLGFRCAVSMGFRYAITLDSDGQHMADDIPLFLNEIQQSPDSLIVGSRLLLQENMPGGSTFANKFSNFWFRLQTGVNMPDTQSGFRLYPLNKIADMHFITNRYEAELEMLVRAAWRGINLINISIRVYYPPMEQRVSHFRPYTDFFRISVLNTFITIIAFVYAYPVKWISRLIRFARIL